MIYLVPTLQDAATRPNLAARIVGVGAVLGFAVEYALVFAALSRMRREGRRPDARWIARALGSSVALFIIAAVTVGQSSLAMFVLPRWTGLAVAGGLIAAAEILSRTVPGWEPVDGLWISIALAAVAVWGVTGMIERNVELARAQATIADMAVQAERSRFARDLHDILGHSLTVLTVKAELAGRLVSIDPARAGQEIAEVEQLAREALTDVRGAVSGYREATLPRELAPARVALDAAGIEAELPGAVDDVPPGRRELLAWAVREGVTNVVRHSNAALAWVRLDPDGVEIADDGVGPDAAGDGRLAVARPRAGGSVAGAGRAARAGGGGGRGCVGRPARRRRLRAAGGLVRRSGAHGPMRTARRS